MVASGTRHQRRLRLKFPLAKTDKYSVVKCQSAGYVLVGHRREVTMAMAPVAPFGSRTRLSAEVGALSALADELADMVSLHAPNGDYLYVSAAVREVLGYE